MSLLENPIVDLIFTILKLIGFSGLLINYFRLRFKINKLLKKINKIEQEKKHWFRIMKFYRDKYRKIKEKNNEDS
jgi:hypothetical protein